ncbi:MAG: Fis family transcriptional regulator [Sphingopyxis macrogoltabida]|uniref:Fis family transcriptional regulator n=1 Tax=Sphingopyxis macrogoltabida TaxID=33050 RepID=A0A2W5L1W5_SPHMC|nr:MAG: Fis family transcriptional regulator [Sphingopyxis macrogoltabida]
MTDFVTRQSVIFVDDDSALRAATTQSLELADLDVRAFADAESALAAIDAEFAGAIVTDIRMPRLDGLEFFARIRAIDAEIPVILITGHADVPMAIGALKGGAFDFLAKPYATDHLIASVRKALETRRLIIDNRMLRAAAETGVDSPLIGDSPVMAQLRATILQIARADIDVLVEGETGTGKELAALLLHRKGPRSGRPFVAVDCGALPEQLAEVELFGHERGAPGFGPIARAGRIEQSDRGTLFLDGIDNMPPAIQSKLLRVLEERKVQPIGAAEPRAVDLHVVASARRDLGEAVEAGDFREDLFYRLNVVRLRLPPLRERRADIPQLFAFFVEEAAGRLAAPEFTLRDAARRHLIEHDWPGNVRELRNFAYKEVLGLETPAAGEGAALPPLPERVAQFEAHAIRDALAATRGDIAATLALLTIPRKTLYDKIARHGIDPKAYRK